MQNLIRLLRLRDVAFAVLLIGFQLVSAYVPGHAQGGLVEAFGVIPKTACRIRDLRCLPGPCEPILSGPEGEVQVGLFGRVVTLWAMWLDLRDPGGKPRPMPSHPEIPLEFDLTLILADVQKGWQITSLHVEPAAGSGVRIRAYDFGSGPPQFPGHSTVPKTLVNHGRVNICTDRVGEVRVELALQSVEGKVQSLQFRVEPILH